MITMSEKEPIKEKEGYEVVKIVFNHTYDLSLAGHDPSMFVDELYSLITPNGLELVLAKRDGDGKWGHWNYDFKTNKKTWVEVDIPENPRVKIIDSDGQFTEMMILLDKWSETHEDTVSKECNEFVEAGLLDFLTRTNQI